MASSTPTLWSLSLISSWHSRLTNETKLTRLFTSLDLLAQIQEQRGTSRWSTESISIDDRYMLLTKFQSASYRPLYIVDISSNEPTEPELIILPNSTEKEEGTFSVNATFSRDPSKSHLVYLITNAYGDFKSVVTYDTQTRVVSHITTPVPNLHAIRPMSWETENLKVTRENILFRANVDGWSSLFVMPFSGPHKDTVIEVKPSWEGGDISFMPNALNGKPNELVLKLKSYRSQGWLARLDLIAALHKVDRDERGKLFISPTLEEYRQASSGIPPFRTLPPKLVRYKSFDGLLIPVMYYHPNNRQSAAPLVINIHGGPENQATAQSRKSVFSILLFAGQRTDVPVSPIHGYLLNEMGCAVMYPNVRGSSGYGKAFLAADDVEKREDSVKDIGALLDHIDQNMKNELDSARIAVMGGSCRSLLFPLEYRVIDYVSDGGYMVYASLTHFSSKLACGVANFGIAHWPSFLQNTASHRRAARRLEYGDETDP
ncbi:hypothetical protein PILCRDRAFT_321523 [Piloderma croceum F 1598]|uniref:Dipeptidyl-peptidase V n=1 Tax=Piloderma croceum (strain F 1598) TaxID=765440 RepID=A0A0C3G341_PILCF|nr:hypothetical protein PILCRDRAFT_321523 [Piloderma croceum F 1598]